MFALTISAKLFDPQIWTLARWASGAFEAKPIQSGAWWNVRKAYDRFRPIADNRGFRFRQPFAVRTGRMRVVIFSLLVAFANSPISAAEKPAGSYTCLYAGTWGCGAPPGGICVDSGARPQPNRFTLQVNFDSKPFPRIRVNGLDGYLNYDRDGEAFVYWHLGGLGHPKFSTSFGEDGSLKATFISSHPNGGYDSSNFTCAQTPRHVL